MKISELLAEGMFVVKNKDGKEKRFRDADSADAKAWKASSSPKKEPKAVKYSPEWWSLKEDDVTVPWTKITQIDNLDSWFKSDAAGMVSGRVPDDWTFGATYKTEVDGCPVAGRKVRLMYAYTKDDDLGLDDDETAEDSQMIGIRRDVKNPEKFVFDGYK